MFRKVLIVLSLILISGVVFYDFAYTHSGRTDANGGHYNRKTGGYHYHNSGRSPRLPNVNPGISPETSLMPYPYESFTFDTAYQLTRIIDGDNVEIRYNGNLTNVSLTGVDTPDAILDEAFGKESVSFIRNLLLGESVYLRFDSNKTDKHGRMLAYLYRAPDGLFVNLEIVRQGYGKTSKASPFTHKTLFQYYQKQAQDAGRGLWNGGQQRIQPEEVPHTKTVYITRTGAKYHRGSCRYLRYSKIPITLESAKQGYSPCSVCRP